MTNLKDGLVLHLSFDEGAEDVSTPSEVKDKNKFQNHGAIDGVVIIKPYEDMSDDSMDVGKNPLTIFDDDGVAFWTLVAGSEADETTIKKHGINSYKVTLSTQTLDAYHDYGANQDWSQYDYIDIYVYGCNTGDTIRVEAWNEVYAAKVNGYFFAITDDFTGWKRFFIPLERFTDIGVPTGWENIMCVRLLGGANQSCIYYFDWLIADVGNWKFGEAADFDGNNDDIVVSASNSLGITDEISLCAWINPRSVSGSQVIMRRSFAANWLDYSIYLSGDDVYIAIRTGNSIISTVIADVISVNTWYFVVGTYDGTNLKIYLDGKLVVVTAQTGFIDNGGEGFVIGDDNVGAGQRFDGLIDECRLYNRALSPEEVRALYLKKVK